MSTSAEQQLLDATQGRLFIDGVWIDGENGTFEVFDPSTGKALKSVADGSANDGERALDAAVAAQAGWERTPPRIRGEILRTAFDLLKKRSEEFALLITLEMGKPLEEARHEVAYGAEYLRWFAEEAVRIGGRYQPTPEGTGQMVITHHAVGPCFLITPWNFPLAMATRKLGPALAAGCTAVVKPAALTPLTTLAFVQLLAEAGLPGGVVNVVTTTSPAALSERLLSDSRLRKVSFTGSTPVGVQLLKQAADNVLKSSMELGGNAPFIVFEDADIELAVRGSILAKFRNIGQACTAANRFFVHGSVADVFVQRMRTAIEALVVGPGTEKGVTIGPLIDGKAVSNTQRLVDDAVARGAELVTGGQALQREGTFFEPTLLDRVRPDMCISREEIFAPVLAVQRFDTEDEAVRLANDSNYGLASYVFTQDFKRGQRMMSRLQTGMLGLNVGVLSNAAAPFGGVKRSGLGREGGAEGIGEYLETMYTLMPDPFS